MKNLLSPSFLLLTLFLSNPSYSIATTAHPINQAAEIKALGWRYVQPFSINVYSDPTIKKNWPDWIDALCELMCNYADSLGLSRTENLYKQILTKTARNFAISTGLLSRVMFEIFEIGNKEWEEPRFAGCKISQDYGVNPSIYPYADWSACNLPFISRTNDPVSEIYKMGKFSYDAKKAWDINPLFMYSLDNSMGQAAQCGYCNVFLMKTALAILRKERIVQSADQKSPFIKLIEALIIECDKQSK